MRLDRLTWLWRQFHRLPAGARFRDSYAGLEREIHTETDAIQQEQESQTSMLWVCTHCQRISGPAVGPSFCPVCGAVTQPKHFFDADPAPAAVHSARIPRPPRGPKKEP